MNEDRIIDIVNSAVAAPAEQEWVEFKVDNSNPQQIGEYISALSNSATLVDREFGYLIYGVKNEGHEIVGTSFDPKNTKTRGQEIENWIATQLSPRIDFSIYTVLIQSKRVVVFEVEGAVGEPTKFRGEAFVRVGTYKKKLKDFPGKARKIWTFHDWTPFEKMVCKSGLSVNEVLQYLDVTAYYDLFGRIIPTDLSKAVKDFEEESFVTQMNGRYSITNLGAILFAKDLQRFEKLKRKAPRVIQYDGTSRIKTLREQVGRRGYAVGFEGLISYIRNRIPANEEIKEAIRTSVSLYPEIAIRELVANMLIHQDFSKSGSGPMVEIFDGRVEITNPGKPIIDILRFIDHSPQSRNEALAHFMRRVGICEERGSGIDKVISAVEFYQLPPPDFIDGNEYTRVKLYAPADLSKLDRKGKIRATYQHCVLMYASGSLMVNATLRKRFDVEAGSYTKVSRIIRDTIDDGLIKEYDPSNKSRRHAKYIPFWA